jgi:ribonuclease BN (tRNA processing enzyme)
MRFFLSLIVIGLISINDINASENHGTTLVLLGTGTPNAEPDRSGPSLAIIIQDKSYIVDFGPGIVRQANKLYTQDNDAFISLKPSNLEVAFLTHLHSDHTTGYPDLIFTPWVLERDTPLKVFGPKGIKSMTENILEAYGSDIRYRIDGSEPANETGWNVEVDEIDEGIVYKDDLVEVVAFKVSHGSWENAFGYKFTTADKTIIISGDTAPSDKLIEMAKGSDILVHEVYSQSGFDRRSEVWKNYHSKHHTSTNELAEIANIAKPKLLLLTHILFWGSSEEEILDEIGSNYSGKVIVGEDLSVY